MAAKTDIWRVDSVGNGTFNRAVRNFLLDLEAVLILSTRVTEQTGSPSVARYSFKAVSN